MDQFRRPPHMARLGPVLLIVYRWLAWVVACAIAWQQGRLAATGWLLGLTFVVAVLTTVFAVRYTAVARRNASRLLPDLVLAAALLLSGGWDGPFSMVASSALLLPALLYGWRGALMAGLSLTTFTIAALWASGQPPAALVAEEQQVALLYALTLPSLVGIALSLLVDLVQTLTNPAEPRARVIIGQNRVDRVSSAVDERLSVRETPPAAATSAPFEGLSLAALTTVRTAEPRVEELRRSLFAPFPTPDTELRDALEHLANRFQVQTDTPTHVTLLGRVRAVPRPQRLLLVRLVQESLLNVQQHAHAEAVSLTLRFDTGVVQLLVQDNGIGLLDGTHERPGLHALRAMNYRIEEFGGRLDIFETDGGGVTVRAAVPIE